MSKIKLLLSWEEYFKYCDGLVNQIKNANFTSIIAIARGGLIPAQYIAYKANIKFIYNFGIITYSNDNRLLSNDEINYYQTDLGTIRLRKDEKILIVDDIADSGRTLNICKEHCRYNTFGNISVATIFYKPNYSIVKPEFYAKEIDNNLWVTFPYDS